MQPGRLVFFFDVWCLGRLAGAGRLRASGKPGALSNPGMTKMAGLGDSQQPLGDAGAKSFIDDAEIKRHGHGIGFVGACVVEFAVDHDRDRN